MTAKVIKVVVHQSLPEIIATLKVQKGTKDRRVRKFRKTVRFTKVITQLGPVVRMINSTDLPMDYSQRGGGRDGEILRGAHECDEMMIHGSGSAPEKFSSSNRSSYSYNSDDEEDDDEIDILTDHNPQRHRLLQPPNLR